MHEQIDLRNHHPGTVVSLPQRSWEMAVPFKVLAATAYDKGWDTVVTAIDNTTEVQWYPADNAIYEPEIEMIFNHLPDPAGEREAISVMYDSAATPVIRYVGPIGETCRHLIDWLIDTTANGQPDDHDAVIIKFPTKT